MTQSKNKFSGARGLESNGIYVRDYEKFMSKLRIKLNRLRKEKNLTIEELANHEMSVRQVKRILNGEVNNITLVYLFKLSKAFKLKLSELLDV